MTTKIQKWGNSLAMRLPKAFAESLNWKVGTRIYFQQVGNILVVGSKRHKFTLSKLGKV